MKLEDPLLTSNYSIIDNSVIDDAIQSGVNYLLGHQYPYGEFCSYYSADPTMQEWTIPHSTIFSTALIVNSLRTIQDYASVQKIFEKATGFFQYQTMRGGAMNFMAKWGQFFPVNPPDIDDTIFVADFLKSRGAEYIDPIQILNENRAKNGLFYTWFTFRFNSLRLLRKVNKSYWLLLMRELKKPIGTFIFWRRFECTRHDIDGVVNANMLYYLGKNQETQPIIKFLLQILEENKEANCDKWYRDPFAFYYFYSRNVLKGIKELVQGTHHIKTRILKRQKPTGKIGDSVLETAMSATALMNIGFKGYEVRQAINYILENQSSEGEWSRHILYYSGPKKQIGWGSEELTTGFCIEALATFLKVTNEISNEY